MIGRGALLRLALLVVATAPVAAQELELMPPVLAQVDTSRDGFFTVSWTVTADMEEAVERSAVAFELEERRGDEVATIAAGSHLSAALSGRDDGTYHYRVRGRTEDGRSGPWSAPLAVEVAHHPLPLAFTLFAVGAVVFLFTAALVLGGHRRAAANVG